MKSFFYKLLVMLRIIKPKAPPQVRVPTNPEPVSQGVPMILIGTIKGAFNPEVQNIMAGVDMLNKVMASELFKKKVIETKFSETGGLSSREVYQKLCSKAVKIDVIVFTGNYMQNKIYKTVGFEVEEGTVNINRYFVSTPFEFASNIIHEAQGHSQGFRHDGEKSTSVPYQLNDIFEACAKEMKLV